MLKCHTSLGLLAKMSALVPSKTVLGLRLLRSLQSSDSFGGPWIASFPGSLGKRWNLGPTYDQDELSRLEGTFVFNPN